MQTGAICWYVSFVQLDGVVMQIDHIELIKCGDRKWTHTSRANARQRKNGFYYKATL